MHQPSRMRCLHCVAGLGLPEHEQEVQHSLESARSVAPEASPVSFVIERRELEGH